jgi:hypothetical protein
MHNSQQRQQQGRWSRLITCVVVYENSLEIIGLENLVGNMKREGILLELHVTIKADGSPGCILFVNLLTTPRWLHINPIQE